MPPPPSRLLDLLKVQCRIFSHTYNPTRARLGTSVLRQRLRGPSVASYYPRKVTSWQTLLHKMRKADPTAQLETFDEDEEQRLEDLQYVKARGKGAPKKKRSAAESKHIKGVKKKQAAVSAGSTRSPSF